MFARSSNALAERPLLSPEDAGTEEQRAMRSPSSQSQLLSPSFAQDEQEFVDLHEQNRPKRPLSAYNLFFQEQRQKMLAERARRIQGMPPVRRRGAPGCKIGFAEMAKTVAAKWKGIEPHNRAKFDQLALIEKARYKREMEEWKQEATDHNKVAPKNNNNKKTIAHLKALKNSELAVPSNQESSNNLAAARSEDDVAEVDCVSLESQETPRPFWTNLPNFTTLVPVCTLTSEDKDSGGNTTIVQVNSLVSQYHEPTPIRPQFSGNNHFDVVSPDKSIQTTTASATMSPMAAPAPRAAVTIGSCTNSKNSMLDTLAASYGNPLLMAGPNNPNNLQYAPNPSLWPTPFPATSAGGSVTSVPCASSTQQQQQQFNNCTMMAAPQPVPSGWFATNPPTITTSTSNTGNNNNLMPNLLFPGLSEGDGNFLSLCSSAATGTLSSQHGTSAALGLPTEDGMARGGSRFHKSAALPTNPYTPSLENLKRQLDDEALNFFVDAFKQK
ncbi:hypothetical protein ACA910_002708 [Epithemia clementina (nom. ined.)]